jgi:hypothetical protein
MFFKDSYLHIVWQKNIRLFYVIVVCIVLTIITNLSKNEITPFFTWSMYSAATPYTDTFEVYTLEYNNGQVYNEPHTWKDYKRMMFYYTIDQYEGIRDNGGVEADKIKAEKIMSRLHITAFPVDRLYNSAADIANYPGWLRRYMQANTGIKMDSIKVYRKQVRFDNKGHVYPVKSELVLKA